MGMSAYVINESVMKPLKHSTFQVVGENDQQHYVHNQIWAFIYIYEIKSTKNRFNHKLNGQPKDQGD